MTYLRCSTCLSNEFPGLGKSECIHPLKCAEMGWIGRFLAIFIGWR